MIAMISRKMKDSDNTGLSYVTYKDRGVYEVGTEVRIDIDHQCGKFNLHDYHRTYVIKVSS